MENNEIILLNGDSSDLFFDAIRSCDGDVVIVSDPPFNIGYKYNAYKDKLPQDEYYEMLEFFFKDYPSVVIHYPEALYKLAFQIGKAPERVVSWVYNSNTPRQHRDIAFFDIEPDFTKMTQPYKNPTDKRIQKLIASGKTGAKLYDWWNINQVKNTSSEKTAHPCQMPLEVMKRIIGILPDNITVIDPFMGSGTTGLAVAELNGGGSNRRFIGIEMDKAYYDIACKRLSDKLCR